MKNSGGLLQVVGFVFLFGRVAAAETLHGPNVNPSNLPVLIAWEQFTGQKAGVIGDNFSADTWKVFREAPTFHEEGPKGAMAEQLRHWKNAFDGQRTGGMSAKNVQPGKPRGTLSDYVLELAIPMFPNRLESESGELIASNLVVDRWQMGESNSRHHQEARRAFQALAAALVKGGMAEARVRLGWEFAGDWFPWSIDPKGGEAMGSAEQFKDCWKFIYLTMEEVNPKFTWVWCSHVGYNHFDPTAAFPEYPEENFLNHKDQADKMLVDFVSVDVYDADGECYFRPDDPTLENFELTPTYWNTHEEERTKAYQQFVEKVIEGRGHLAGDKESSVYGLRFFKEFSEKKGLPFLVSEWGPWANYVPARNSEPPRFLRSAAFGGDDNPLFIDGLFRWFRENEVQQAVLFEFYNGGEGDTVDHTLLPNFWNSSQEGRPAVSSYPVDSPYSKITNQLHPRAAEAYLRNLKSANQSK